MNTKTLVKELMEFRSVSSDVKAVNRVADFLRRHFRENGVPTRIETLAGRKILYASTSGRKDVPVLLNAHLDVVPADEKTFGAKEKGGWIYGRGSGDCLGNSAVVAQLLIRCLGKADIGAVFSTDEEVGGQTTKHMVSRGYRGRFVLVVDGGSNRIAVAQKGIMAVRLKAAGKSCHGSTPWKGINAIDRLIEGYLKVKKLFPPVKPGDEWHDTMSGDLIQAGTVFNRVPDSAEMVLDVRYTGKTPRGQLLRKIGQTSGLKVELVLESPQVVCDEKHPKLTELVRFMQKKLRRKVKIVRMNGATDARHFVRLKVPIAMIGVPSQGAHAANEAVSIKGMQAYEDMLYDFCLEHASTHAE